MSQYPCPACNSEISLEDIHVANDIALCKSCGKQSSFSQLSHQVNIDAFDFNNFPSGVKVNQEVRGGLTITYKKWSPIVLFLIPFTALWSGGSMFGIYGSQISKGKFDLFQSLFGLPFLFGTFILVSIIIYSLIGEFRMHLSDGLVRVFMGVGNLGRNWTYQIDKNTVIQIRQTNIRVNNRYKDAIYLIRGSEQEYFGTMLRPKPLEYFSKILQRYQQSL